MRNTLSLMKTIEIGRYNTLKEANTIKEILEDKSEFRFMTSAIEAPSGWYVFASTLFEAKKKQMRKEAKYLIDKTFWT